ncbi:hypothetical protein NDU88_001157 [Pleurodeles waltl]|uniref:Uncharacterized protein n=1 Tax=Pleurodeles waltl TaxID=8319 RepID=A0AAV7LA70_PLEWA|nr:hypothetical protein NDU88_001157 [Pleurodeles waltl]
MGILLKAHAHCTEGSDEEQQLHEGALHLAYLYFFDSADSPTSPDIPELQQPRRKEEQKTLGENMPKPEL